MKKVLAWIKSNLLIVVFSAIILLTLPAAFVGSTMWGDSIRTSRADQASKTLKSIEDAKMNYQIPPVMPGGQGVDEKRVPNTQLNALVAAERKKLFDAAQSVTKQAEDFNRGVGALAEAVGRQPHKPLIDGLFPKPAEGQSSTVLTTQFVDKLVNTPSKPSVYAKMLRDVLNAGDPVDMARLGQQLATTRSTEIQKLLGNSGNDRLSPEQQKVLDERLVDVRRQAYLARAGEISVYANMSIFPTEGDAGVAGSVIPRSIPSQPPGISRAFQWQMDYWMIRDLLAAVRIANTSSGGGLARINDSVVKRIERIEIADPFAARTAAGDPNDPAAAAPIPATTADQLTGLVPSDLNDSVSGRKSSPQNPLYDVRRATLKLVVSAPRLRELFNAFAKANFMTIIDMDLKEIDVAGDLDRGFFYGNESVVSATIVVETVWLRGWTEGLFPPGVRKQLALSLPEGETAPDHTDMIGASAGGGSPGDPFNTPPQDDVGGTIKGAGSKGGR